MKLKLNTIVEDFDGKKIDIKDELSGRIIFSKGDNFGEPFWWFDESKGETTKDRLGIDFFCGPETKDGWLEDTYDCGLEKQLTELLEYHEKDFVVGSAENYHEMLVPLGWTVEETWDWLKDVLTKSGAIEKIF